MCKKEDWWLWAPAPGNGITLDNGVLVIPTQGRDQDGLPFSNITFSDNGGKTWKTSEPASSNTTECSVVQLEDNTLMLNIRDNRNRKVKGKNNGRAVFVTADMGKTWMEHSTSHSALQEPVCMASLFKHEYMDGQSKKSILFFSNPNTQNGRYDLTIKASFDNGQTWPEKYWLLLDEGYGRGYSSITSIDEKSIGILYEGSQSQMTFQTVALDSFLED
jgi:sialidase-1